MLHRINRGGLDIITAGQLEEHGFIVAFSGRMGGTSVGDYAGLNLSYNVGDDPRAVCSNRKLLAESLGLPVEKWVLPRQVHGCDVNEVGVEEAGRGAMDFASGIPGKDGLVTRTKGLALGVLTADCVPIVMIAPRRHALAVVHAGWRGVLGGIAAAAARKLARLGGCQTREVYGLIGPHIGSCCMEVGAAVAESFDERFNKAAIWSSPEGKLFADLETACRSQLEEAGLIRGNVFSAGVCTMCDPGYFSYRGSGGTCGRQGAVAAIVDESGGL
jgi:YfiH family protein